MPDMTTGEIFIPYPMPHAAFPSSFSLLFLNPESLLTLSLLPYLILLIIAPNALSFSSIRS